MHALKDGFSWRAGSGSSSLCYCPWSSLGLKGSIVPNIDIHDFHLKIRDVLSTNGPHTQFLYSHLPHVAANVINNMHIKFNPSVEDASIWNPNRNGVYTTKSGYTWLLSRTNMVKKFTTTFSWSWIWKLKLSEKHKFLFFGWLVTTLSLLSCCPTI